MADIVVKQVEKMVKVDSPDAARREAARAKHSSDITVIDGNLTLPQAKEIIRNLLLRVEALERKIN
jgi:hypothetical protein